MKFCSIDLELNQPSNKIIQIGAVCFDTDSKDYTTFNMYVDPGEPVNWDHKLNIGVTLEELLAPGFRGSWGKLASPSKEALTQFWAWLKSQQNGKKLIQWGRGDLACLLNESQGLGYPSHLRVLDLKLVYQFLWQPSCRLEKHSQLGTACKNMGVEPPAPAHDAFEDALATGLLFKKMFKQIKGLNELLEGL